jgi:hypothetical protein
MLNFFKNCGMLKKLWFAVPKLHFFKKFGTWSCGLMKKITITDMPPCSFWIPSFKLRNCDCGHKKKLPMSTFASWIGTASNMMVLASYSGVVSVLPAGHILPAGYTWWWKQFLQYLLFTPQYQYKQHKHSIFAYLALVVDKLVIDQEVGILHRDIFKIQENLNG